MWLFNFFLFINHNYGSVKKPTNHHLMGKAKQCMLNLKISTGTHAACGWFEVPSTLHWPRSLSKLCSKCHTFWFRIRAAVDPENDRYTTRPLCDWLESKQQNQEPGVLCQMLTSISLKSHLVWISWRGDGDACCEQTLWGRKSCPSPPPILVIPGNIEDSGQQTVFGTAPWAQQSVVAGSGSRNTQKQNRTEWNDEYKRPIEIEKWNHSRNTTQFK